MPSAPTKKELEEHLPLHVPYKSWCPVCVAGEGIHNQARRTTEEYGELMGVSISMVYCFLTNEGEKEDGPTIRTIRNRNSWIRKKPQCIS